MSTTNTPSYDCATPDCPNTFSPGDAVAGSFCSEACKHRHTGQKLLNAVQHDHKFCANCGTQLKEIEKPTDETLRQIDGFHSTTALVGYQYRTPQADTGEIDIDDTPGREAVSTGTICGECGNTNQSEVFPEDHDRHLLEYGQRFLESLREKRREGVHDKRIDEQEFFDALVETEDLVLGLGRAIE